jgi:hypothetical protein
MNKKHIAIIISLLLALVLVGGGFFLYNYQASFRTVDITLKQPDMTIRIYTDSEAIETDKPLATIDKSTSISLREGAYVYVPDSDKVEKTAIAFEVSAEPTDLTVDPSYSDAHLASLLESEMPTIRQLLNSRYQPEISSYTVESARLFDKGEWFAAALVPKIIKETGQADIYRVVLHKQNSSWEIIAAPDLVLTSSDYPDIPRYILRYINQTIAM